MKVNQLVERLATRLPKNLRGPLANHVKTLRELIEGEMEAARKSPDKAAKTAVARKVVATCSAVCTTVGVEPIPLADFPILTALQVVMIACIMHVSGREISRKGIAEFFGALGMNIGAGLLFRETARTAIKFLPGFGSAISGAVAGGATYTLGRAAMAYFIDGVPMPEVRSFFRKRAPRPPKPPPAVPEK
ncbi:MAG: hypothetical protein ABSE62_03920 [Chthoniobacteraceae bacterium]